MGSIRGEENYIGNAIKAALNAVMVFGETQYTEEDKKEKATDYIMDCVKNLKDEELKNEMFNRIMFDFYYRIKNHGINDDIKNDMIRILEDYLFKRNWVRYAVDYFIREDLNKPLI